MKHVIYKAFWSYEKEEAWLNAMAAKGLALSGQGWIRFVFEDTAPGEYVYRIELLEELPSHPESQRYIRFMEDNGVEQVGSWLRWVYFRRKAAEGSFDIYSDRASRLKHYQRVRALWLALALFELALSVPGTIFGISHWLSGGYSSLLNLNTLLAIPTLACAAVFACLTLRYTRKIRRLRREQAVSE